MSDVPGTPAPMVFKCGGAMAESGDVCNDEPLAFGVRWKHTKKALDRDHDPIPVQTGMEPVPPTEG